jgi:hypothetical protein
MRRFGTLSQQDSTLQTLYAQAEHINALQKAWETAIPPSLKRHCHAGLLDNQQLTVYATSGTIAAKLKLLTSGLLAKLKAQGLEVTAIRVKVQVKSDAQQPAKAARRLSSTAIDELKRLVSSLPDSPLRTSLKQLANRR